MALSGLSALCFQDVIFEHVPVSSTIARWAAAKQLTMQATDAELERTLDV